jgi:hypothetical protein
MPGKMVEEKRNANEEGGVLMGRKQNTQIIRGV